VTVLCYSATPSHGALERCKPDEHRNAEVKELRK